MTTLAALLTPAAGNPERLDVWTARTRAADLPFLHSFATGLERDRAAVDAALTLPWHGRAEGVSHKIKPIKRQMHGRAGFPLLRQRRDEEAALTADSEPPYQLLADWRTFRDRVLSQSRQTMTRPNRGNLLHRGQL